MLETIRLLVFLLAVIVAVSLLANRLRTPPAILLVIVGVLLALTPGLPRLELSPDVVLLIVLPPLIYSAAARMSWREFRRNLQAISLLAVGGVAFTTAMVATATCGLLGFSWPLGVLVGAIVAPPDAVAPLSIARALHLPRRLAAILEGEGLANDAAALVLYRFAVASVGAGAFSVGSASAAFIGIIVTETIWGLAIGWLTLRLRRWTADPSIEVLISVLTPFLAFWPPQMLGGSGVLAAVAAGLYVSSRGPVLISPAARVQGVFFWRFSIYLVEAMVFLATGLQAHKLIAAIGLYSASELALSTGLVTAVVIGARFLWVYPAVYAPRWLTPSKRRTGEALSWQETFLLSFTGMRGVVSLSAALSIPDLTDRGDPFPHRDLILFLTFCVILFTLVGQGLVLPLVIRRLGLSRAGRQESRAADDDEVLARRSGVLAASRKLAQLERELSSDALAPLHNHIDARREAAERRAAGPSADAADGPRATLALIDAERVEINTLARSDKINDQQRLRLEHELDLQAMLLSGYVRNI